MRVVVTGATGRVGRRLVADLQGRGDDVTVLSRSPSRAGRELGVAAHGWDSSAEPAPPEALDGRDAVVHLAGEDVNQRWSDAARQRIRDSRVDGTRRLVEGLAKVESRPKSLLSSSGYTYYGPRGDEPVDETEPPGNDFLARTATAWEQAADSATDLGLRVVKIRTGLVLDAGKGGALDQMLPAFKIGLGGPLAGGRQFVPWIHIADLVGMILAALDDERWRGPVNATAPHPVTNRELAKAVGRVLGRPAVVPTPGIALRLLYGERARLISAGVRAIPARAQQLNYRFRYPELEGALGALLDRSA